MAIFSKKTDRIGGIMDVIRCDEPSYLIWKWHPSGSIQGSNTKENAIRWGSSLRVKEGEVAVFVYNQPNGILQDYIAGPYDGTIKTKNLPVLARILGLLYDGNSPFQAEVYFINLAKIIQVPFGVPYFDLYDPRFLDFGVPTAVRGTITFNITDYMDFIKLHRLINFDLTAFQNQIRDAVVRYVKAVVTNVPEEHSIPVVQIERKISLINDLITNDIKPRLEKDFGVNVVAVDINAIDIDKTSNGYIQLKRVTQDVATATTLAQTDVNIKNLRDMQQINAENLKETMRIQREEAQYAQHKQTQSTHFAAYQLEQQAAVGIAGAEALGNMGTNGATEMTGGGGMNPAAMMTGMAMGGAIGQNMANIMNGMMNGVNNPQQPSAVPPPPPSEIIYHVVINGQSNGPYNMKDLSHLVSTGQLSKDSLVWKQGFADWIKAENVQELSSLFSGSVPPPIPPI